MDVGAAADRAGIAEPRRHRVDGAHDVALECRLRCALRQIAHGHSGEHGARPGSEVLRCERATGDFAQIRIDGDRVDALRLAAFIEVLKERLSRQLPAARYDPRERGVVELESSASRRSSRGTETSLSCP